MANALVIGFGSIGQRHARVLEARGHAVAVVSRRAVEHARRYPDPAAALAEFRQDYVVIANETGLHRETLRALLAARFAGTVLVEKPLFHDVAGDDPAEAARTYVAYNLRFHPL